MSVISDVQIRRRLWRGYDNPSLPIGMWVAWIGLTGDASGGDSTMDITMENAEASPAVPQLTGNHYNLEALEIQSGAAVTRQAALQFINLSVSMDGAQTTRQWSAPLISNQLGDAGLSIGNMLSRPIFLGTRQLVGTGCFIRLTLDNVDGQTEQMWAEGYIWSARSIMAEGGLQRPLGALYG